MINEKFARYVAGIISEVRKNGDSAISRFTARFDGIKLPPGNFRVPDSEIHNSACSVSGPVSAAIKRAAENIRLFHENERKRLPVNWKSGRNGITAGQYFMPVESAGLYVCGGMYPYPSTVLMCAIPARVAGVGKIVMVTPPGNISGEVLFAAKTAGVDEVYRIGGAQAVAALAFGTKTIPKADLIAGPGNQYVTEAKRQLFGEVGVDLLAGPSEAAVICDSSADIEMVAFDLLAQAEHRAEARSYVFCSSITFAKRLKRAIKEKIRENRRYIPHLGESQITFHTTGIEETIKAVNRLAPEHLEIIHRGADGIARRINNAGAIFIGKYSPVALGDYYAGPSHVLPTGTTARFSSGISVMTFMKRMSIIKATVAGIKRAGRDIINLAASENMKMHAESVKKRMEKR